MYKDLFILCVEKKVIKSVEKISVILEITLFKIEISMIYYKDNIFVKLNNLYINPK